MKKYYLVLLLLSNIALANCLKFSIYQAEQALTSLASQIQTWDKIYQEQGTSQIPDEVYDQLVDRYQQWQVCFPQLQNNVKTRLSASVNKVMHPVAHTGVKKLVDPLSI
ncbi:hypothetical protein [Orbus mooreae]|uniref:hypothetical protein n=1 Tax=Orbus mooreae TaxID=3074107 RepID=UPI00370D860D